MYNSCFPDVASDKIFAESLPFDVRLMMWRVASRFQLRCLSVELFDCLQSLTFSHFSQMFEI